MNAKQPARSCLQERNRAEIANPIAEDILAVSMNSKRALMQAIVYDDYGDAGVLRRTHLPVPEREHDELLVEFHASSVNSID